MDLIKVAVMVGLAAIASLILLIGGGSDSVPAPSPPCPALVTEENAAPVIEGELVSSAAFVEWGALVTLDASEHAACDGYLFHVVDEEPAALLFKWIIRGPDRSGEVVEYSIYTIRIGDDGAAEVVNLTDEWSSYRTVQVFAGWTGYDPKIPLVSGPPAAVPLACSRPEDPEQPQHERNATMHVALGVSDGVNPPVWRSWALPMNASGCQ